MFDFSNKEFVKKYYEGLQKIGIMDKPQEVINNIVADEEPAMPIEELEESEAKDMGCKKPTSKKGTGTKRK